ncbi:MAG: hypothetical protein RXN78_02545 [Vulcanisaeta sp.]
MPHDYQYNGFDTDFSRYRAKDGVLHDITAVIEIILRDVKNWFRDKRIRTMTLKN